MDLRKNMHVNIKPNTYFYLALLLFLVPFQWLAAWFLAVCVHEIFHFAAVRLCGGTVTRLDVGVGGMEMETSPMTDRKRLISILSGPIGGFALVFLGRWFPKTAICGWVLSVYNLFPLLPLDGGRALQILLGDEHGFNLLEKFFLVIVTLAALYAVFILGFGILPIAIVSVLWLRNRKIPCKEGVCKVQ